MDFYEVLDQIIDLLRQRGRVSYQALKRQFDVDDGYLEDLKVELIEVQELAADRDGKMLVWSGEAARTPEPTLAPATPELVSPAITVQAGPPIAHTPPYLAEKIRTSRHALEGERKQVTVLFADIKDSTELIRDLDPEAAQQLLDPAIHLMMEAVHRFEGTVNQVLGDGIMALFGAPVAHEDHALRACYAALAMQAAMQPYTDTVRHQHGIEMQMRVGLNSGEVVVRTIGNDLHMDYSAVGPTTHLAARMEQLARPGSIRFPASTLRLVEGFVRVQAIGPVPVKGMSEPVEVYELMGASAIRRRLQAAVARDLTRFVGRDTEIAAINHTRQRAAAGHGQIVAAVGEAGVGKSRLMYEFVHSHRTQGWLVLESASVSYGKATPYFPVVDLLRRYVRVEEGDDARIIRAKVTGQLLTLDETLQETIPALLSLMDALPEDSPFLQLDPPQRRQRTLDALKRVLLRESQVQPLLLVFEDLHWIDTETQALLDSLVESLPTAQILLLVNYRPEYQHGWGSKTYYTQLRLDPLPPESADAFLEALLGDDPILEPLKKLLIERTEGNPFFLEESVRTLVETGVLVGAPGAYRLAQALPTIQVPATVQAVLAARIDRLSPEAKRLLQTAAVIGTEVPFALLRAIAELSEEGLHRGLTHLQTAEFLYETSLFPERVYTFKHALTHEVAYGSILQERRRMLHAQIVEALEALADERLEDQVERLAYHAFRGEVWEKALIYLRHAGTKAVQRSAYREATAGFEQALVALRSLPETRERVQQAIDLRFEVRSALQAIDGHDRVFEHLRNAETLASSLEDQHRLGWASAYLSQYLWRMGDLVQAEATSQRALTLAAALGDFALEVVARFFLGQGYFNAGDYRRAMDHCGRDAAVLVGQRAYERYGLTGLPAVLSRIWLAWSLAECGEFAEAMVPAEEALAIAESARQPYSVAAAYLAVGQVRLVQGALAQAIPVLEHAAGLCKTWSLGVIFPTTAASLGLVYALSGRIAEALPILEEGEAQATLVRIFDTSTARTALATGYLLAGRLDEAAAAAARAAELAADCGFRGHMARTSQLLGEISAHREPPDVALADDHYRRSLALAEEFGMRPLQAHCHRGLGTLYGLTGQSEQARAELSTAIDMYREMGMTFWLLQAEVALTQVE
jgi:class 3 adenylate cyclase/tetratricopeptide (TPR) repeat protein